MKKSNKGTKSEYFVRNVFKNGADLKQRWHKENQWQILEQYV